MKACMIAGRSLAVLTDNNEWSCSDLTIQQELNRDTLQLRKSYSPADGWLRPYLFYSIVAEYKADGIIDDEPKHESAPASEVTY